jgi:GDP-L-fucose synthase
MENYDGEGHVNVGTGVDVTIGELAHKIKEVIGYEGQLIFNTDKPDGTPRKLLDVSLINSLGWKHTIDLDKGIRMVVDDLAGKGFVF